jgi:rubrerythrin
LTGPIAIPEDEDQGDFADIPYCWVCGEWHADGDDGKCPECRALIEGLQVATADAEI